jgi:hypothetical protein
MIKTRQRQLRNDNDDNVSINKYEKYSKILILGGKVVDKDYKNVNLKLKLFDYILVFGKCRFEYCKLLKCNKIYLFDTLDEVILYIKNNSTFFVLKGAASGRKASPVVLIYSQNGIERYDL